MKTFSICVRVFGRVVIYFFFGGGAVGVPSDELFLVCEVIFV